MKLNLNRIGDYIYKKYGGQVKTVHIFDKSLLSNFNLNGEMMISKNTAQMLGRAFAVIAPLATHLDIEFDNPNKE